MPGTVCSQCGGTDIEYDQARGDAVCTGCGSVLEDNIIVSEVTFVEQSSGSSSVIGQFVSAEGGSKAPLSGTGFHHGLGKDSREVTLQQAKKRLTNLGKLLKLNQHCIDSAFMFFKMALQMNLTRGRKSSIIDTACLYLVCRSEGTPHLLLDFSDVLQINVYALGRAYLRLSTALHISPPAIDPCLYIHRFAHKLELGDKTHEVSMTALRLVARMKRDWIHHGRRPAGLCGAALLVAARLHNFNRSVREVARVVKLSVGTVRKRLGDFKDTPSSRLTIEEFLKVDLEQEHDPPCFTESKKKIKQLDASEDQEEELDQLSAKAPDVGDDAEEEEKGFGGIKMDSVTNIIAKARFNESYLNANIGLSENLEHLASHFESEQGSREYEQKSTETTEQLDLTGIDDQEIDKMLLSEEEVKVKTQLWFAENGDYLKDQEARRAKQAAIKAEKEKSKKRPCRTRKSKCQPLPASSAGEAIERMLVERKISTKINYDVLRDLTEGVSSGQPHSGLNESNSLADQCQEGQQHVVSSGAALIIDRSPSTGGRLPSITTRKRSSVTIGLGGVPLSKRACHRATTMKDDEGLEASTSKSDSHMKSTYNEDASGDAVDEVIEENGPVEYLDDEGVDDNELEQLAYEGDPLLHSEYEDEGDYFEDVDEF